MSRRRVVVTGLGCVSPVGNTVSEAWSHLLAGQSGIAPITRFDASAFSVKFAGEVKGLDLDAYIPPKEARAMDSFIHYGIVAAIQAVADAGLPTGDSLTEEQAERIGCVIGSGIGGLPLIEDTHAELTARGPRRISPFFVPASIINMISGHVSMRLGFKGPNLAVVTACTTGLHSIGEAGRLIEYGDADVMVAGGSEATVSPLGVGGFAAMRALSTRNDDPAAASRPWDKDRDGFVLGEGAGVLVLEEYEHAKKTRSPHLCGTFRLRHERRRRAHDRSQYGWSKTCHGQRLEKRRHPCRSGQLPECSRHFNPLGRCERNQCHQSGFGGSRQKNRGQLHQIHDGSPLGRCGGH